MNRRLLSVTVFLALMLTSLLAGRHNYHVTRNEITADLNQALALTLLEKKEPIVTQDTIRAYKQLRRTSGGQVLIAVSDERFCRHLKNRRLKETSFLTFDVVDKEYQGGSTDEQAIYSDTLMIRNGHAGETLALKGYNRLSAAAAFGVKRHVRPALACRTDGSGYPLGHRFDAVLTEKRERESDATTRRRMRTTG